MGLHGVLDHDASVQNLLQHPTTQITIAMTLLYPEACLASHSQWKDSSPDAFLHKCNTVRRNMELVPNIL